MKHLFATPPSSGERRLMIYALTTVTLMSLTVLAHRGGSLSAGRYAINVDPPMSK